MNRGLMLRLHGPGVTASLVSASDTQIVVNVTVAISSPGGTATVSVQLNGYVSSGFRETNPGQSSQITNSANVQPVDPAPQILFNGANVFGTTQNAVVGQQIALSIAAPPSGLSIQSGTWSGVTPGPGSGTTSGSGSKSPATNIPTTETPFFTSIPNPTEGANAGFNHCVTRAAGRNIASSITEQIADSVHDKDG